MVLPHMPLWAWWRCCSPPRCSRHCSIRQGLDHPRHPVGRTLCPGHGGAPDTLMVGQVAGAVGGGIAVQLLGVRPSLVIDAVTFVLSSVLIRFGTRATACRGQAGNRRAVGAGADGAGFRLVFGDPALRTLLLFGWLVVFYTIPEGIAAPYAKDLGGGSIATGLVLASTVLSTTIIMPLFTRFVRPRQRNNSWARWPYYLWHAGPDGPAPRPCRLAGDLLVVGRVRRLPDRGQHRIRDQDAERTPGSGLRHRQHGRDRRPGRRLRSGRRRRGGAVPRGGHRHRRRSRRGGGLRPDTQVAPSVATWRTACGGTASRSRRGQKLSAATRVWVADARSPATVRPRVRTPLAARGCSR